MKFYERLLQRIETMRNNEKRNLFINIIYFTKYLLKNAKKYSIHAAMIFFFEILITLSSVIVLMFYS